MFEHIVTELAHQYVLSYTPTNLKPDGGWRNIKVQVRGGKSGVSCPPRISSDRAGACRTLSRGAGMIRGKPP